MFPSDCLVNQNLLHILVYNLIMLVQILFKIYKSSLISSELFYNSLKIYKNSLGVFISSITLS